MRTSEPNGRRWLCRGVVPATFPSRLWLYNLARRPLNTVKRRASAMMQLFTTWQKRRPRRRRRRRTDTFALYNAAAKTFLCSVRCVYVYLDTHNWPPTKRTLFYDTLVTRPAARTQFSSYTENRAALVNRVKPFDTRVGPHWAWKTVTTQLCGWVIGRGGGGRFTWCAAYIRPAGGSISLSLSL